MWLLYVVVVVGVVVVCCVLWCVGVLWLSVLFDVAARCGLWLAARCVLCDGRCMSDWCLMCCFLFWYMCIIVFPVV